MGSSRTDSVLSSEKKRSFKEIVVSTIKILKGKDGGQDDGMDIGV